MARRWINLIGSASLAICAGALAAAPAMAEPIRVLMNQAKIVRLDKPADTIVIGNPLIADASVQDASTIVLTGKGFGVTNLVILDEEGTPIFDEEIVVARHVANSVRVYRRSEVQTLSCAPFCEGAFMGEAERQSQEALNRNR